MAKENPDQLKNMQLLKAYDFQLKMMQAGLVINLQTGELQEVPIPDEPLDIEILTNSSEYHNR